MGSFLTHDLNDGSINKWNSNPLCGILASVLCMCVSPLKFIITYPSYVEYGHNLNNSLISLDMNQITIIKFLEQISRAK